MRRVPVRRAVAAAWLAFWAAGCAGWQRTDVAPQELLRNRDVAAVRVTKRDSTRVEVFDPVVTGDTLRGLPTQRSVARMAIALSDIREISTRKTSLGKTALAILAIGGGVALYGLLMSLNEAY